jgi:hypothetical protein
MAFIKYNIKWGLHIKAMFISFQGYQDGGYLQLWPVNSQIISNNTYMCMLDGCYD